MNGSGRSDRQLADVASFFDGSRLTLARQLAGLKKNALAELIGKTPTAVAAYENGSTGPSPSSVAQLAMALGVDPDFFLPIRRDVRATMSVPHFRSLRSTTTLARDQAQAYGLVTAEIAATFERHVELPNRDIPQLTMPNDDLQASEPEVAARALRSHWEMEGGPVGHLVRIAESRGTLLVFSPVQAASVDAYSFDTAERPIILMNPIKHDYYRQRFDVAHELGHIVMHADADPGGHVVEQQAHRFASEFLLPAEELRDLLPSRADWRALAKLKETWGVSLQALLFRAKQLKIMNDNTYRNAMTTVSTRGWRRQEPGPMPTVEQPSMLPRSLELLIESGYTEVELAAESRAPLELFRQVTARQPTNPVNLLSGNAADEGAHQTGTHRVVSLLSARSNNPS